MEKKFTSYVRAYRRRWGFTQDELAFMMGFKSRSVVSKLERSTYVPTLLVGYALDSLFGTRDADLFPSLFLEVEAAVLARAYELYERIQGSAAPMTRTKLDFLEELFKRAQEKRELEADIV
jgi:transcriptional regulator with XRE-family HTH domain